MIDPFTLATGVFGILGLAIQLAQVTKQYTDSVMGASKSISALHDELKRMADILVELKLFLDTQKSTSPTFKETSVMCRTTKACEAMFVEANKKMEPFKQPSGIKKVIAPFRWPLSEEGTRKLTLDIQRYTATFQFSLTIQGCGVLSKTAIEVDEILKTQVDVLHNTQMIANIMPSLAKEVKLSLLLSTQMLALLGSSTFNESGQKLDSVFKDVSFLTHIAEAKMKDDKLAAKSKKRGSIMQWLNQVDSFADYQEARDKHISKTGTWLLSSDRFREWDRTPNSMLWIHGVGGCGKTIMR